MAAPDLRHGLEVQRTSVQKQTHIRWNPSVQRKQYAYQCTKISHLQQFNQKIQNTTLYIDIISNKFR